jgi:hypothetical protein
MALDAPKKIIHVDRLGQDGIGSLLEEELNILWQHIACQADDQKLLLACLLSLPQGAGGGWAVHDWHLEVHEDEIKVMRARRDHVHTLLTVLRLETNKAFRGQQTGDQLPIGDGIIYNQDREGDRGRGQGDRDRGKGDRDRLSFSCSLLVRWHRGVFGGNPLPDCVPTHGLHHHFAIDHRKGHLKDCPLARSRRGHSDLSPVKRDNFLRDPETQTTALPRLELIRIELNSLSEDQLLLLMSESRTRVSDRDDERADRRLCGLGEVFIRDLGGVREEAWSSVIREVMVGLVRGEVSYDKRVRVRLSQSQCGGQDLLS